MSTPQFKMRDGFVIMSLEEATDLWTRANKSSSSSKKGYIVHFDCGKVHYTRNIMKYCHEMNINYQGLRKALRAHRKYGNITKVVTAEFDDSNVTPMIDPQLFDSSKATKGRPKAYTIIHRNGFIENIKNLSQYCIQNMMNYSQMSATRYNDKSWYHDRRIMSVEE